MWSTAPSSSQSFPLQVETREMRLVKEEWNCETERIKKQDTGIAAGRPG